MNIPSLPSKEQAMVPNEDNRPAAFVTPLADIETTDDGYVIRAEMPGVEKHTGSDGLIPLPLRRPLRLGIQK
jgi:hypothetical protein